MWSLRAVQCILRRFPRDECKVGAPVGSVWGCRARAGDSTHGKEEREAGARDTASGQQPHTGALRAEWQGGCRLGPADTCGPVWLGFLSLLQQQQPSDFRPARCMQLACTCETDCMRPKARQARPHLTIWEMGYALPLPAGVQFTSSCGQRSTLPLGVTGWALQVSGLHCSSRHRQQPERLPLMQHRVRPAGCGIGCTVSAGAAGCSCCTSAHNKATLAASMCCAQSIRARTRISPGLRHWLAVWMVDGASMFASGG